MSRKNLGIIFIFILTSIILQSCFRASESDTSKNANTNQAVISSNANNGTANVYDPNSSETYNNAVINNNSGTTANNKTMPRMSEPAPKIGSGGNDLALLLQVRGKLSSDKELINSVIVEVNQGNATLTGKVLNEDQKKKAEQMVQSVEGIESIKNNLRVSP